MRRITYHGDWRCQHTRPPFNNLRLERRSSSLSIRLHSSYETIPFHRLAEMRGFSTGAVLLALAFQSGLTIAAEKDDKKTKLNPPCTAHSPSTGGFFDLRTISLSLPEAGKKPSKNAGTSLDSWHARGWDYGTNFTLNVCGPVLEDVRDVVGVETSLWKNVSASYSLDGKTYSMG